MDTAGMVKIPGGTFLMGSVDFYPGEHPVRAALVHPFWIDEAPVTNERFRGFVADVGYVTVAGRPVTTADYPDADHRC